MPYLLIQIALLMIGAYLIGAIVGCLLRRLHDYVLGENAVNDAVPAAAAAGVAVPPVIEVAEKDSLIAGEASRFEKALSHGPQDGDLAGGETTSQAPAAGAVTSDATIDLDTPTFSPIEETPPAPVSAPTPVTSEPIPAPEPPPAPVADESDIDGVEGEEFTAVSVAAAAAAAAMAARASDEPKTPEPVVAPPPAVPVEAVVEPAAGAPVRSDLTRIKGISADTAERLNTTGVVNYDQIAGWQASDVTEVEAFLNSPGVVSRGNWIEQAQILASGGVTAFARDMDAGVVADAPVSQGTPAPSSSGETTGMPSLHVSEVRMPDGNVDAGTAADEPEPSDPVDATLAATVAAVSAAAAGRAAVDAGQGNLGAQESGADALENIYGVDATTAGLLNGMGVTRFDQIANWSERDISHYESALGTPGRIGQERWIEQAQYLAHGEPLPLAFAASGSGASEAQVDIVSPSPEPVAVTPVVPGEPESSTSAAPAASTGGYQGFRSVRSEALRGDADGPSNHGVYDDLKRIRGVGLLIERKLNAMGVFSYEQVANWSQDDIARVSQVLGFKGRIERENWVEQGRILAAGGATEFSKRMDRGST